MRTRDELRALADEYLGDLALTPELHGLAEPVRYAIATGGKLVRPVICLDTCGEGGDLAETHRLKTGRLFAASVACALWAADVPEPEQRPWRAFAEELGPLFQIVDDLLDDDGYVLTEGRDATRRLADESA